MKPVLTHKWDLSPSEAMKLQRLLSKKVIAEGEPEVKFIAGVDVSVSRGGDIGYAAVVVVSFPELEVVEVSSSSLKIPMPYVPGLLSFRESPMIIKAFEKLKIEPDLIMVDGQGIAHPRRFGIASHLGVLFDKPSIGVAKTRLVGGYEDPEIDAGSFTFLYDGGEVIGAVVRTRSKVKPVFVSVGHKVSLEFAVKMTLSCCRGYRLPEPTRLAHIEVNRVRIQIGKTGKLKPL